MKHTILIAVCLLVVFSALAFGAAEKQIPLSATVDRSSVKVGEHILLTVKGGVAPLTATVLVVEGDFMCDQVKPREFRITGKKPTSGTVEVRDAKGAKFHVKVKVLPAN